MPLASPRFACVRFVVCFAVFFGSENIRAVHVAFRIGSLSVGGSPLGALWLRSPRIPRDAWHPLPFLWQFDAADGQMSFLYISCPSSAALDCAVLVPAAMRFSVLLSWACSFNYCGQRTPVFSTPDSAYVVSSLGLSRSFSLCSRMRCARCRHLGSLFCCERTRHIMHLAFDG